MAKSRLSKRCRTCQFRETCEHKQWIMIGEAPCVGSIMSAEASLPSSAPMMRETMNTVNNGSVVKVYKDEIEQELYGHLYEQLNPFQSAIKKGDK